MSSLKIKAVVADYNSVWLNSICQSLKETELIDVEIIGRFKNGELLLKAMLTENPNLVITNFMLPSLDAIGVVQRFVSSRTSKKLPMMFGMIPVNKTSLIRDLFYYGFSQVFIQPCDVSTIVERVYRELTRGSGENPLLKPIELEIADLMNKVGISHGTLGNAYTYEALMWAYTDYGVFNQITKLLYPGLAKKFGTRPSCVERSIRQAKETAWIRGDINLLDDIFGYTVNHDKGTPTNTEWLAGMLDYIKVRRIVQSR